MESATTRKKVTVQDAFVTLNQHLNLRIIGQTHLTRSLLIALIADGHLLVEGAPGLAKTTAVKELAQCIEGDFHRLQFTPDLLPADLTGTDIFHPQDGSFSFQQGPLFHNLLLADEINRAPAKVQSALLEAMAEQQVTIGKTTYGLPDLFMVMATQNPIEQEGTYPLPEAQLDRFLLYVTIDYPSAKDEQRILALNRAETQRLAKRENIRVPHLTQETVFKARQSIHGLHLAPALEDYIVQLVMATRNPAQYGDDMAKWIRFGASPRGTIGLERCARSHAWLKGQDFVSPDDIHAVIHDVLRHRILLTFEAEAQGITPDNVINELLNRVAVP